MLTVDGELRRSRLSRAHEQAELAGAIADTKATFDTTSTPTVEGKGWQ